MKKAFCDAKMFRKYAKEKELNVFVSSKFEEKLGRDEWEKSLEGEYSYHLAELIDEVYENTIDFVLSYLGYDPIFKKIRIN